MYSLTRPLLSETEIPNRFLTIYLFFLCVSNGGVLWVEKVKGVGAVTAALFS